MKKIVILILVLGMSAAGFSQSKWSFDKAHAKLSFSIVHMKISHVEGNFKAFDVKLMAGKEDFSDAAIEVTADINSINTDIDMRDKDLKSDKYFNAEKFPTLSFKSTSFKKIKDNKYKLTGNITIHGIMKSIALDVVYNGSVTDPFSNKTRAGFTITGKLNRVDFGVGTSSMVLSDDVEIEANVEFLKD